MMNTKNGGAVIDTSAMLSSGAMEGPYRKTKPRTLPLWVRVLRSADKHLLKWAEFRRIYLLYRKAHGRIYSARIAHGCAFRGLPF